MKRLSASRKNGLYLGAFFIGYFLDEENLLIDDKIYNLAWLIMFPVFLILSFVLVLKVFPSSEFYRKIQNQVSSKIVKFSVAALVIPILPLLFLSITAAATGIFVNYTASRPVVLVLDRWSIEKIPSYRDDKICTTYIKINDRLFGGALCTERGFGFPTLKTQGITRGESLCIKGRDSFVGVVVDQMATIPNEGLDMEAKKLRCAQLFGNS